MTTQSIYRGATVQVSTTFYDASGLETQPPSATINFEYISEGQQVARAIAMTAPGVFGAQWTVLLDTRDFDPGLVSYSIHTGGTVIPFAVEDGCFQLLANNANLPTW